MQSNRLTQRLKRRRVLQGIGWFSGSLLLAKGCAQSGANSTSDLAQTAYGGSSPTGAALNACVLYPQQTEGPFYLDLDLVRQDITEGKPGVPLKLLLTVNDAASCTPIPRATVDIWHCDALGNYAGSTAVITPGPGGNSSETFLRGTQITDANGQVEFDTIYPGWYPGRATHIHLKVHLDENTVLTSQMYFPEQVTRTVYAQEPYNSRPNPDTTNARDFLMGNSEAVLVSLSKEGQGYTGRLTIGVAG
jgi:protocatechuate 3,4-dioxygenase beta subunit